MQVNLPIFKLLLLNERVKWKYFRFSNFLSSFFYNILTKSTTEATRQNL